MRTSSLSEKPDHPHPRRLADWLNPTGTRKVHSLVDKVYKRKNLELAWEKVRANKGAGGVDGQSIEDFEKVLDEQLDRLHRELKEDTYSPQPVHEAAQHMATATAPLTSPAAPGAPPGGCPAHAADPARSA